MAKANNTQLRILVATTINGVAVPSGRVALVTDAAAKSLIDGGVADPAKEAIAYALSENDEVIDTTIAEESAEVLAEETETETETDKG